MLNSIAYALNFSVIGSGLTMTRICLLYMIKTTNNSVYVDNIISTLIDKIKGG